MVLTQACLLAAAILSLSSSLKAVDAFVSPSMLPQRTLPWTAQQTSSTLQYRTLGNTALVNEYLHIHKTADNRIAVMSNMTTAAAGSSSSSSGNTSDMLIPFASQEYAYEGYSYNNNERILQLESVIQSMQFEMEQQNNKLVRQQAKTKRMLLQKKDLQALLKQKELDYAESMTALLDKYESLELQFETERQKVVFPQLSFHEPATVATIGQIKEWADQSDQGRTLARQALEEGRVQSHRITMSFNQRLRTKDHEIQLLKEQLVMERRQRSISAAEQGRRQRSAESDLLVWINQVAHIMVHYAKLQSNPPKKQVLRRTQSLFSTALNRLE